MSGANKQNRRSQRTTKVVLPSSVRKKSKPFNLDPRTARDADLDRLVLEGRREINFGRGVPDPTPFGVESGMMRERLDGLDDNAKAIWDGITEKNEVDDSRKPVTPASIDGWWHESIEWAGYPYQDGVKDEFGSWNAPPTDPNSPVRPIYEALIAESVRSGLYLGKPRYPFHITSRKTNWSSDKFLYHATPSENLPSIAKRGIIPQPERSDEDSSYGQNLDDAETAALMSNPTTFVTSPAGWMENITRKFNPRKEKLGILEDATMSFLRISPNEKTHELIKKLAKYRDIGLPYLRKGRYANRKEIGVTEKGELVTSNKPGTERWKVSTLGTNSIAFYDEPFNEDNIEVLAQNGKWIPLSKADLSYWQESDSGAMADEEKNRRLERMTDKLTPQTRKESEPKKSWLNETPYGGDEAVLEDIGKEARFQKALAAQGKWSAIHSDHYDWWAFPIDRGSSAYGDFYNVAGEPLKRLRQNQEFLKALTDLILVQTRALGYNLYEKTWMQEPDWSAGQDWGLAYPTRIWKMTRSAQIFGLEEEFESLKNMQKILSENGIRFNHKKYWEAPGTVDEVPPVDEAYERTFSPKTYRETEIPNFSYSDYPSEYDEWLSGTTTDGETEKYDLFENGYELADLLREKASVADLGYPYHNMSPDVREDIADTIDFALSLLPASDGDGLEVDRNETADALEKFVVADELYQDDSDLLNEILLQLRNPESDDDSGMMRRPRRIPKSEERKRDRNKRSEPESGSMAVLNQEQINEIIERYKNGDSVLELANDYRVTQGAVYNQLRKNGVARKPVGGKKKPPNFSSIKQRLKNRMGQIAIWANSSSDPEKVLKSSNPLKTYLLAENAERKFPSDADPYSRAVVQNYEFSLRPNFVRAAIQAGLGLFKAVGHKTFKVQGPITRDFSEKMIGPKMVNDAIGTTYPTLSELGRIFAANAVVRARIKALFGLGDPNDLVNSIATGRPLFEGGERIWTYEGPTNFFQGLADPDIFFEGTARRRPFVLSVMANMPDSVKKGLLWPSYKLPVLPENSPQSEEVTVEEALKYYPNGHDLEDLNFIKVNYLSPEGAVLGQYVEMAIEELRQWAKDNEDWASRWAKAVYETMSKAGLSDEQITEVINRDWLDNIGFSVDGPGDVLANATYLADSITRAKLAPFVHLEGSDTPDLPLHEFFHANLGQGFTRHGEYTAFLGPAHVYDSWYGHTIFALSFNDNFWRNVVEENGGVEELRKAIEKALSEMMSPEYESEERLLAELFPEYARASAESRRIINEMIMDEIRENFTEATGFRTIPGMPRATQLMNIAGFRIPKRLWPWGSNYGGKDRILDIQGKGFQRFLEETLNTPEQDAEYPETGSTGDSGSMGQSELNARVSRLTEATRNISSAGYKTIVYGGAGRTEDSSATAAEILSSLSRLRTGAGDSGDRRTAGIAMMVSAVGKYMNDPENQRLVVVSKGDEIVGASLVVFPKGEEVAELKYAGSASPVKGVGSAMLAEIIKIVADSGRSIIGTSAEDAVNFWKNFGARKADPTGPYQGNMIVDVEEIKKTAQMIRSGERR